MRGEGIGGGLAGATAVRLRRPSPGPPTRSSARACFRLSWTRSPRPSPPSVSAEVDRRRDGDWAALLLRRAERYVSADAVRRSSTRTTRSRSSSTSSRSCSPSARPSATRSSSRWRRSIPRATPAMLRRDPEGRPLPGQPGNDRSAARRHLPAGRRRHLGRRASLRQRRLHRDHRRSSASSTASSSPQVRKAKELAERDLKAGDTLSAEFEAVCAADRQGRHARRR